MVLDHDPTKPPPESLPPDSQHIIPAATAPRDANDLLRTIAHPEGLSPRIDPSDSHFSLRTLRSHIVLVTLIFGTLLAARHVLGVTILQPWPGLIATGLLTVFGAIATGLWHVDWWSMVLDYWWFSIPGSAAVGLAILMMVEGPSTDGDLE